MKTTKINQITEKVEIPEPVADRIIANIFGFEGWLKENRERFNKKHAENI